MTWPPQPPRIIMKKNNAMRPNQRSVEIMLERPFGSAGAARCAARIVAQRRSSPGFRQLHSPIQARPAEPAALCFGQARSHAPFQYSTWASNAGSEDRPHWSGSVRHRCPCSFGYAMYSRMRNTRHMLPAMSLRNSRTGGHHDWSHRPRSPFSTTAYSNLVATSPPSGGRPDSVFVE